MPTKAAEQLGITNLKRVIGFLLITAMMIKDLIKKFDLSKAVQLGFHIAENQNLLQTGPTALAEFKDLDVPETQELTDFFGEELDLENDNLEYRIEEGLDLIPEGYALIRQNLDFYLKASAYVRSWGDPSDTVFEEMNAKLRRLPAARAAA